MPTVHPNNYVHGLLFAVFCLGWLWVDFIPIIQGYFTGNGVRIQSYDCTNASEVILKIMGKYITWIHNNCPYNLNKHCWKIPYAYFMGYTLVTSRGPFYLHGLTLIPAWISNCIHDRVWDEIINPSPNFKGTTIQVWDWACYYSSTLWLKLIRVNKGGPAEMVFVLQEDHKNFWSFKKQSSLGITWVMLCLLWCDR